MRRPSVAQLALRLVLCIALRPALQSCGRSLRLVVLGLLLVGLAAPPTAVAKADRALRQAQEMLEKRGFDPGPIDGLMGTRTRRALREFQRAAELPVTGRLDRKTRAALRPKKRPDAGKSKPASAASKPVPEEAKPNSEDAAAGDDTKAGASTAAATAALDAQAKTPPSTGLEANANVTPAPGASGDTPDEAVDAATASKPKPGAAEQTLKSAKQVEAAKPDKSTKQEKATQRTEPAQASESQPAESTNLASAPAMPSPAGTTSSKGLSFKRLGWATPASGKAIALRHGRGGSSPIKSRETGTLVIPDAANVYVLERGERVPGFSCNPSSGALRVDLAMGVDGPITVTSLDGKGFCQLGFGVLLEVGQVVEFEEAWWGERKIRGGRVRVGPAGLEYLGGG